MFQNGSNYYLHSASNNFWVAKPDNTDWLTALGTSPIGSNAWERFTLLDLSPPCNCSECGCTECFPPDGKCGICENCNPHDNLYISNIVPDNTYIELHNPTETPISAKGLYLSNDNGDCFMWQMPLVIVRPNQRVLIKVYDEINSGDMVLARMQTDFDLAHGDTLRLSEAGGNVLSAYDLQ